MNILFFHSNGIDSQAGGISRSTANLAMLFRSKGHQVWFGAVKNLHPNSKYDDNQFFLPVDTCACTDENVTFLVDLILNNRIDVVINQSILSKDILDMLCLCRMQTRVRIFSCFHNSILTPIYNYAFQQEYLLKQKHLGVVFHVLRTKIASFLLTGIYKLYYRNLYRHVVDNSNAVVLLTDGQLRELADMTGYKTLPNAHVIYNYVVEREHAQVEKQNNVVWVGTMDVKVKRPDLMLEIWRIVQEKHQDWQLQMIGSGAALQDMKSYAKKIGAERVTFTGRVNPEDYYAKAKILGVTSTHESFSLVSVEAMSNDVTTIMFNSFTSAPLLTDDGNCGVLVTPFSIHEYAEKLAGLMGDESQRASLNKKANKNLARFSPDRIYCMWDSLFSDL